MLLSRHRATPLEVLEHAQLQINGVTQQLGRYYGYGRAVRDAWGIGLEVGLARASKAARSGAWRKRRPRNGAADVHRWSCEPVKSR